MKGKKLHNKTWDGVHVGYAPVNAYRTFTTNLEQIFVTRNVTFFEKLYREKPSRIKTSSDTEKVGEKASDDNFIGDDSSETQIAKENSYNYMETNIGEREPNFLQEEFHDFTAAETGNIQIDECTTISGRKVRKTTGFFALAFMTAKNLEENQQNQYVVQWKKN